MARKRANLSDLLNNLTFRIIYNKFKLVAVNRFEWSGLPDGITERHIENWLFERGKVVFFRDPDMSYMCLPVDETGAVNQYGDPTEYRAVGFAGYRRELNPGECVIIENNKLRLPTEDFVIFYTNKLAEAERTMDVNIKACKTPVIFTCDNNDLLSFKRLFEEVDGNRPAVWVNRGLNLDTIQAFQTGVKFLGKELTDYAQATENKLLTFLGVNNAAVEKRERLITDEANANNQLIESFSELQLEARERACEAINNLFGLSVSVRVRGDNINTLENDVRGWEDVAE